MRFFVADDLRTEWIDSRPTSSTLVFFATPFFASAVVHRSAATANKAVRPAIALFILPLPWFEKKAFPRGLSPRPRESNFALLSQGNLRDSPQPRA